MISTKPSDHQAPCLLLHLFSDSLSSYIFYFPLSCALNVFYSLYSWDIENQCKGLLWARWSRHSGALKIPSVTTGSNAVACEYPDQGKKTSTILDENACPSFLAKGNTRNKSYHLPHHMFFTSASSIGCPWSCSDYHVKQSKSDKCKNIKCNVDPIHYPDEWSDTKDNWPQLIRHVRCSREFSFPNLAASFPARGAQ